MAQTADVPATHPVAEQIREVERARLRALVAGDAAAGSDLHAPDFQLVTPVGAVLSKDEYLTAIATGHIDYVAWEPGSIDVRLYGNAAVIRYQATLEVVFAGHAVPRATYWHTDSYENNDGQWRAVWSQATEIRQTP
ncbi:nuclear transport factor 2 family protein [Streptomyces sp. MB09-02B]|uniref:nuclear transport factor 2 family protein n=1 Tax=Streptomyces sp. MB09-02B TaxID=3028667 RepID=UPI0029AF834A|nr:nuclear transport factor 2 family protein [Streptomyces sp. MB09-02B]MDX3638278.1 nuclear transport factor 2 family protein [Streptomyces sp. MB09-02B]